MPGDLIVVETPALLLRCEISGQEFVTKNDGAPLMPVPGHPEKAPTERLITLSTCGDRNGVQWGNSHRIRGHGHLTGWLFRSDGTPTEVTVTCEG